MHYFRAKREIVGGVLDRLRDRLIQESRMVPHINDSPTTPARASLLSILNLMRAGYPALTGLAAMLGDNEIRTRIAAARAKLFDEIGANTTHPEKVAIAMLLVEGLLLNYSIGHSAFGPEVGIRVARELTRLLDSL